MAYSQSVVGTPTNIIAIAGVRTSTGTGAADSGTLRTVLANGAIPVISTSPWQVAGSSNEAQIALAGIATSTSAAISARENIAIDSNTAAGLLRLIAIDSTTANGALANVATSTSAAIIATMLNVVSTNTAGIATNTAALVVGVNISSTGASALPFNIEGNKALPVYNFNEIRMLEQEEIRIREGSIQNLMQLDSRAASFGYEPR